MKKSYLTVLFAVVVLVLASIFAWANPATIQCHIDGQRMYFDHTVGYGKNMVCWYSHTVTTWDAEKAQNVTSKHEAYIPCGGD